MIIHVGTYGQVELQDANDFKGFKIVVERAGMKPAELGKALKGIATLDPEGKHAWVSQDALRNWKGQRQPEDWIASFDQMVEKVKKYGFVDEEKGAVRAHIEAPA